MSVPQIMIIVKTMSLRADRCFNKERIYLSISDEVQRLARVAGNRHPTALIISLLTEFLTIDSLNTLNPRQESSSSEIFWPEF